MKRILTALILIPLVLILILEGPHWLVTLSTAAVALLAAWEYLTMAVQAGAQPSRIVVLVAIATLFLAGFLWPDQGTVTLAVLCLGLLVWCTFFSPVENMMADLSTAIVCLLYTGFTLTALPALREESNGPSLVIFLLCVVWAGDSVALYVGKAWGRHKLAPTISPNKTWEGSIGSIFGSLLATGALLGLANLLAQWNSAKLYYRSDDVWYWLGLAVVINIAAQIGDLAESALKRSVGVKDSGTLLPGHGGILDRIDALLVAAPVLWCVQIIHQRIP